MFCSKMLSARVCQRCSCWPLVAEEEGPSVCGFSPQKALGQFPALVSLWKPAGRRARCDTLWAPPFFLCTLQSVYESSPSFLLSASHSVEIAKVAVQPERQPGALPCRSPASLPWGPPGPAAGCAGSGPASSPLPPVPRPWGTRGSHARPLCTPAPLLELGLPAALAPSTSSR